MTVTFTVPRAVTSSRLLGPARWALIAPVSWFEVLLVAVLTSLVNIYAYLVSPDRPGPAATQLGFFGWYDQREYLRLMGTLIEGHLPANASEYVYGLGYPLLAVPFKLIGIDSDPFFLPDIGMVAVAVAATYVVAARVISRFAGVAVVTLLLVASPLVALAIVPWTSTVTLMALAVSILIVSAGPLTTGRAIVLGLLAGLVFSARYVDVVVILLVIGYALIIQPRESRWRTVLAAVAPAALSAGVVLLTHYLVLGSPFTTPYATHYRPDGTSDQSFAHYSLIDMIRHFVETFITAQDHGTRVAAAPLLLWSPFLVLMPVGAVLLLRRKSQRGLHITLLMGSLALSALYLSFVAGGGIDLLYRNYRYWVPFYPYWTILSVLAVYRARDWFRRRAAEPAIKDPSA